MTFPKSHGTHLPIKMSIPIYLQIKGSFPGLGYDKDIADRFETVKSKIESKHSKVELSGTYPFCPESYKQNCNLA